MSKAGIAVVLAAAVALVASAAAPAGQTFPSKVTIEFSPAKRVSFFSGKVKSPEQGCTQRLVLLMKQRRQSSKPKRAGSDFTDPEGKWSVEESPNRRFYFAKVKPSGLPESSGCAPDSSPKLEFPE